MNRPRVLMLVSAAAGPELRRQVASGHRPCPEYLRLESGYDVELLDWSRLPPGPKTRSVGRSLRHVVASLRRFGGVDVVFTDGEHLGIPLAIMLRALGRSIPHLMLGHHLTTPAKRRLLRSSVVQRGITRILVHSRRQQALASTLTGIRPEVLAFVPYYVDTAFWQPLPVEEAPLILAVGQEHRDYLTLARACAGLDQPVFIARGSAFSPRARLLEPEQLPEQFSSGFLDHASLRTQYARAAVVVVPLIPNDFQAGVTSILESMAMGKATVVSATDGQRDIIEDGETGLLVSPGDAGELRRAIRFLLARPAERHRLGTNARRIAAERFGLEGFAATIWQHCNEIAPVGQPVAAGRI